MLLVAEDTDSNFLLVSLMFRKEFDIVRAVNGEEAVRICREMKPAAILMDIKMPVMDGLEATRRIRAFDPVVPIVAVTAFAYDRDRQKALAAGANEYVAKPLSGRAYPPRIGDFAGGGITAPRVTGFADRSRVRPFSGGSPAAKQRRPLSAARQGNLCRAGLPRWPRPFLPCFRKICQSPMYFLPEERYFGKKYYFCTVFMRLCPAKFWGCPVLTAGRV